MLNNVIINYVITMRKLINSTLQYEEYVICCLQNGPRSQTFESEVI